MPNETNVQVESNPVTSFFDSKQEPEVEQVDRPKFDVLFGSPMDTSIRFVIVNEALARKFYEYLEDCGIQEGDECLWALGQRLKTSFQEIPSVPKKRENHSMQRRKRGFDVR